MAKTLLPHCVEVEVWMSETPLEIVVDVSAGGTPGDGTVEVVSEGSTPSPGNVPSGCAEAFRLPGCTRVLLHYRQGPNGPDSLPVEYVVS